MLCFELSFHAHHYIHHSNIHEFVRPEISPVSWSAKCKKYLSSSEGVVLEMMSAAVIGCAHPLSRQWTVHSSQPRTTEPGEVSPASPKLLAPRAPTILLSANIQPKCCAFSFPKHSFGACSRAQQVLQEVDCGQGRRKHQINGRVESDSAEGVESFQGTCQVWSTHV